MTVTERDVIFNRLDEIDRRLTVIERKIDPENSMSYGQVAYEAYCASCPGSSTWDERPEELKRIWETVGNAVTVARDRDLKRMKTARCYTNA